MKNEFKKVIIFVLVVFFLLSGLIYLITANHRLRPNREIHGWNTEKQIEKKKKMRHDTIPASNGNVAWAMLQENIDVDLIITDVVMPGMDGRNLIKLIRSHQDLKGIPIIIISGYIKIKKINDFLEHGKLVKLCFF